MSPAQYYMLKTMSRGLVPLAILRKWDQRPLAGLWRRGLIRFTAKLQGEITQEGWNFLILSTQVKLRKDFNAPIFRCKIYRKGQSA